MNTLDIASSSSSDDEEEDEKEAAKESKSKLTYTSPFGLSEATWKKEAQRVLDNYLLVHKVLHPTYTRVHVYILHSDVCLT
jgi:hypothetical protein